MPHLTRAASRMLSNNYCQGSEAGDQMSEIRSQRSPVSTIGSGRVSATFPKAGAFKATITRALETTLRVTFRKNPNKYAQIGVSTGYRLSSAAY